MIDSTGICQQINAGDYMMLMPLCERQPNSKVMPPTQNMVKNTIQMSIRKGKENVLELAEKSLSSPVGSDDIDVELNREKCRSSNLNDSDVYCAPDQDYPLPMDSKINIRLLASESDSRKTHALLEQFNSSEQNQQSNESCASNSESMQMFSPPNRVAVSTPSVPDFFRLLEPKGYEKLCQQTSSNVTKKEEEVTADAVKHKLNIMHLMFPGDCTFVSSWFNKYV